MKALKTPVLLGARTARPSRADDTPSVTEIYADHAELVWKTLHRMGVREADLPDMLQETFVVVHRRLCSYDGSSRISTWLYGICARVAARYRRKAHVRREHLMESVPEQVQPALQQEMDAERTLSAKDAQLVLDAILASMDVHKRAVFVMFEIEEMSCAEIAATAGVPVGTVHSRLHAARKSFRRALARMQTRSGGRGMR